MSIRFGRSGGNYSSSEVMETENDDWRKIEDVAERRRIQNRLAQRNYRRKLRAKLEELEKKAQQAVPGAGSSALSAEQVARSATSESSNSSSPLSQDIATEAPYGQQITLSQPVPDSSDPFHFDISLDKFLEGVDDIIGPFPVSVPVNKESPRISEAGDKIESTPTTYGSDFTTRTTSSPAGFTPAPFGMPMTASYRPPAYLIPPSFSPPPEEIPVPSQPTVPMSNGLDFLGLLQDSPWSNALTPSSSNTSCLDSPRDSSEDPGTYTGKASITREDFITAMANITLPPDFHEVVNPTPTEKQRAFLQTLMSYARPTPVPSDHKFLTLQYHSIVNASLLNGIILSCDSMSLMDDEAVSPFYTQIAPISPNLPKDLEPTQMQRTVHHHPYIDIIPFPGFRDRILRCLSIIDEDDLCHMMYADWGVWGSRPWDKTSWEVGEKFAEKYWFLMDEDMKKAADFWRSQRGLKPLKSQQKRTMERGRVVGEI